MRPPIFLSYPKPWSGEQDRFVAKVCDYLRDRGLEPRTLGVTDYDVDAPMRAIRRLMLESNGLVTLALRRIHVSSGVAKLRVSESELADEPLDDCWLTTPWPHVEASMAFQLGLPILIFREQGVLPVGVLESGVVGAYMPEVDLGADLDSYFGSSAWTQPLAQWEARVRRVIEHKGNPPALY